MILEPTKRKVILAQDGQQHRERGSKDGVYVGMPARSHLLNSPHTKFKGDGIGDSEAEVNIPLVFPFTIFGGYQE